MKPFMNKDFLLKRRRRCIFMKLMQRMRRLSIITAIFRRGKFTKTGGLRIWRRFGWVGKIQTAAISAITISGG